MPISNNLPGLASESTRTSRRTSSLDADDSIGGQGAIEGNHNGLPSPITVFNPYYTGRPRTPVNRTKSPSVDRQELIRKIKSRESRPASPELERPSSSGTTKRRSLTPLQPPTDVDEHRPSPPGREVDNQTIGVQIERPRSALHRGDFREKGESALSFDRFGEPAENETTPSLATSPVAPWHPGFPAAAFRQAWLERRQVPPPHQPSQLIQRPARLRAASTLSLARNFTYQPPTSPLVQASRPDTPEPPMRQRSRSPDKSRRYTFSPQALQRFSSTLDYPNSARSRGTKAQPHLSRESKHPYQAHQPRRSLNSFSSLPHTPVPGIRRPSVSDSPLHHAPMVGSYEESILRGRMSSTPSKPLNFVAQIGVLGKGECKQNLRCPPHVTVPFPAVFYSFSGSKASTNDQPSPYVGLVDLENDLPSAETSPEKRRQRLENRLQATLSDRGSRAGSRNREEGSASDRRRRRQKQKRRSGSPKTPPGGSYRIPQQGQLQIVLKNPNKTAVKLFLVPYDLSDMEAGKKTFIRQRSYSAGPVIDMPLASRKNLGTDRPEASLSVGDDPSDRPTLRYLVHLHICCPSKGRYFLYKSIRVVFANRVPDGKEKLRQEIQVPEPKYSIYKTSRDSNISIAPSSTPHKASRRLSAVDPSTPSSTDAPWPRKPHYMTQSLPSTDYTQAYGMPTQPLPFHFNGLPTLESRPSSRQTSDSMDIYSERSQDTQSARSAFSSPAPKDNDTQPFAALRRLDEPFNFERDSSRERQMGERSESLLSRRLRDLAFQAHSQNQEQEEG